MHHLTLSGWKRIQGPSLLTKGLRMVMILTLKFQSCTPPSSTLSDDHKLPIKANCCDNGFGEKWPPPPNIMILGVLIRANEIHPLKQNLFRKYFFGCWLPQADKNSSRLQKKWNHINGHMSVIEESQGGKLVRSLFCLEKTDIWPGNSQWIPGQVSAGPESPNQRR